MYVRALQEHFVPLNMKWCICHFVADTPFHIQGPIYQTKIRCTMSSNILHTQRHCSTKASHCANEHKDEHEVAPTNFIQKWDTQSHSGDLHTSQEQKVQVGITVQLTGVKTKAVVNQGIDKPVIQVQCMSNSMNTDNYFGRQTN